MAQPVLPEGPFIVKSTYNNSFLSCNDNGYLFFMADDNCPRTNFMMEEVKTENKNSHIYRIRSLYNNKHWMRTNENWIDAAADHQVADLSEVISAKNGLRFRHVEQDRFVNISKDPSNGNNDRLSLNTTDVFEIFKNED